MCHGWIESMNTLIQVSKMLFIFSQYCTPRMAQFLHFLYSGLHTTHNDYFTSDRSDKG